MQETDGQKKLIIKVLYVYLKTFINQNQTGNTRSKKKKKNPGY